MWICLSRVRAVGHSRYDYLCILVGRSLAFDRVPLLLGNSNLAIAFLLLAVGGSLFSFWVGIHSFCPSLSESTGKVVLCELLLRFGGKGKILFTVSHHSHGKSPKYTTIPIPWSRYRIILVPFCVGNVCHSHTVFCLTRLSLCPSGMVFELPRGVLAYVHRGSRVEKARFVRSRLPQEEE